MFKNPFSFEGRIRRAEYGLSFIIFVVARIIVAVIAVAITSDSYDSRTNANGLAWLFSLPFLWFFFAQGAKRCHDVGNSGWWQLIPFYPLWLIFQDGQRFTNEYAEDPKAAAGNYPPSQPPVNPGGGYYGGYDGG